jgi:hypothetical protein
MPVTRIAIREGKIPEFEQALMDTGADPARAAWADMVLHAGVDS